MSDDELLQLARKIKKHCKARHCIDGCTFVYFEKGSKKPHCKLRDDNDTTATYPEDWKV